MILETLDTKKKDIFIYSENKFDLKNNFRLINKDDLQRSPVKIHFNDVCNYLNEDSPKSLILYRLLTNLPYYDLNFIKYGIPVLINGNDEIIHFDPVFAIKELEEYSRLIEFPDLRFRIQQIGLISYGKRLNKTNFSEVYCFDLDSLEAKWQNDRVFGEIIFAFNEINFDKVYDPEEIKRETILQTSTSKFTKVNALTSDNELVEEDKNFHPENVKTLSAISIESPSNKNKSPKHVQLIEKLDDEAEGKSPSLGKPILSKKEKQSTLGQFIKKIKTDVTEQKIKEQSPVRQPNQVIDLFKSSKSFQEYLLERGKKQVVLKLKNK